MSSTIPARALRSVAPGIPGGWRLVVASTGETVPVHSSPIAIGSAAQCPIRLAEAAPVHVEITPSRMLVAHAPCTIGGVPIRAGEERLLATPCAIEIGAIVVRVEEPDPDSAISIPTRQMALAIAALPATVPLVVVVQGPHMGEQAAVPASTALVAGRDEGCGLRLSRDGAVSRRHVEILLRGSEVVVRDLHATQGTFLGTGRLEPARFARWPEATMLRVSERTVLALRLPPKPPESRDVSPEEESPSPSVATGATNERDAAAQPGAPRSPLAIERLLPVFVAGGIIVVLLLFYWALS